MTLNRRSRPVDVNDAPERRDVSAKAMEMRKDEADDNLFTIEGYASTFEPYEMYGGPSVGGWIEQIDPGAFDKTLREKPDLHLLLNHTGATLARTKSGTCKLSVDEGGLKVVAKLDKRDPDAMALFVKMDRGDLDEMSFAFRVKAQEWRAAPGFEDDNQSLRTITEVSIHKGDVSVVNHGANDTTSVGIRSAAEAVRYLAELDDEALAEVRGEVSGEWLQRIAGGLAGGKPEINITNAHVADMRGQEAGTGVEGQMETFDDDEVRAWLDAERSWQADVRAWLVAESPNRLDRSEWLLAECQHKLSIVEWLNAERAFSTSVDGWLKAEAEFLSAKPAGATLFNAELAKMQFNS